MKLNKYIIVILAVSLCSCSRPIAKYTFESSSDTAPATIKFNNESENAEGYQWNFGDGSSSTEQNPEYKYLLSGKYDVELLALKGKKKGKLKKTIIVKAPEECLVLLETRHGNMLIQLFDDTPAHRDNFTKLIEEGYFDGLLFHRVIDRFMIQGGDPNSRDAGPKKQLGTGGPGYQIEAEFNDEFVHFKGALAAARQPDRVNPEKKSSGSQFYIVHGSSVSDTTLDQVEAKTGIQYTPEQREEYKKNGGYPFLDTQYTVFGRVIEGMEVIDLIAAEETSRSDRPREDVQMKIKVIK